MHTYFFQYTIFTAKIQPFAKEIRCIYGKHMKKAIPTVRKRTGSSYTSHPEKASHKKTPIPQNTHPVSEYHRYIKLSLGKYFPLSQIICQWKILMIKADTLDPAKISAPCVCPKTAPYSFYENKRQVVIKNDRQVNASSQNIIRNESADFANIHFGLKIELQNRPIAKGNNKLAVNIQHTGRFNSKILDLRIRIGKIGCLFTGYPLHIDDENPFVRENHLIPNRFKGGNHRVHFCTPLITMPYAPLRSKGFGFIAACAYIAFSSWNRCLIFFVENDVHPLIDIIDSSGLMIAHLFAQMEIAGFL